MRNYFAVLCSVLIWTSEFAVACPTECQCIGAARISVYCDFRELEVQQKLHVDAATPTNFFSCVSPDSASKYPTRDHAPVSENTLLFL